GAAIDLAIARGNRRRNDVPYIHLHSMGRSRRHGADSDHTDRLVLAERSARRGGRAVSARDTHERPLQFAGDLSHLPAHGHSHRSLTWWGMMGLICVEGTALALAVAAYPYMSA